MYKYLSYLIILSFNTALFSQPHIPTRAQDDSSYYIAVEVMPEPIGGIAAIQSHINYPESALRSNVEGKVYVLAYINETGSVDKTKILMGIDKEVNEAASKAVLKTKFTPGMQDGVPVKVEVSIPIVFKLQ